MQVTLEVYRTNFRSTSVASTQPASFISSALTSFYFSHDYICMHTVIIVRSSPYVRTLAFWWHIRFCEPHRKRVHAVSRRRSLPRAQKFQPFSRLHRRRFFSRTFACTVDGRMRRLDAQVCNMWSISSSRGNHELPWNVIASTIVLLLLLATLGNACMKTPYALLM